MGRAWRIVAVGAALLFQLPQAACESILRRGPTPADLEFPDSAYRDFSGELAWGHLEALVEIGPRVSGTRGADEARRYLRDELLKIGAEVEEYAFETEVGDPRQGGEMRPVELVSLVGVLPGQSDDIFLLAAPYDTAEFDSFRFVGANSGASGPALLLEIARILSARTRHYTVWLAFLDGDALASAGSQPARFLGSELLSKSWAKSGVLDRVRLAVFVDRVADADLTIARDVRSNSLYRDLFWQAAKSLRYQEEFAQLGFESPATGHHAFLDQRLRRVVALVDNRYGAGEPPGSYWQTEDDTPEQCSPESLTKVGQVTLEGLHRAGQRLAKIDRFARSPF